MKILFDIDLIKKINASLARKIENGQIVECRWDELYVGDAILVKKNEQVPADVVLFFTSELGDIVHIDTCNLDGEANYKMRQAIPQLQHLDHSKKSQI